MARRSAAATALALPAPGRPSGVVARTLKQIFAILALLACVLAAAWLYVAIEDFLVSDARFALPGPPEPGVASANFIIEGARNVTNEQVVQVFASDFGRSVFLCPLKQRRLKLLGIDWVQEASISRLWPNRIVVRIIERTPVAFAQLQAADGAVLLSLVDGEGVLLNPQRLRSFKLPVVTGITRAEAETSRRERVKRFLRLQSDLGSYMDKVSEIDVSHVENVRVVQQFDGRAVVLMLGNGSFRERYENFLDNEEQIRKRLPDATVLDLRLKDRITAVSAPSRPPVEVAP